MSDLPGLAHVVGDPVERLLRGSALLLAEEEVWGELLDHVQVDGPRDCELLHPISVYGSNSAYSAISWHDLADLATSGEV